MESSLEQERTKGGEMNKRSWKEINFALTNVNTPPSFLNIAKDEFSINRSFLIISCKDSVFYGIKQFSKQFFTPSHVISVAGPGGSTGRGHARANKLRALKIAFFKRTQRVS